MPISPLTAWFTASRFGIFVHWGPYASVGRGEQVLFREHLDQREYARMACAWNPGDFDARTLVRLAKEAGARYCVFTTRHHDGYCLWDSELTDYSSAMQTPGRDFVREYVEACRAEGMAVGLYYSLADWRIPAYWLGAEKDPDGWRSFLEYVHGQVGELLTQYGKIDVLWFDGPWPHSARQWDAEGLMEKIRGWQPDILINNRLDAGALWSFMSNRPSSISLWPNNAPGALGKLPEDIPTLTAYFPENIQTPCAAFVICPGGAYGGLAGHEGEGYAKWLNQYGIAGLVLKYRLGSRRYRHPTMLNDAARAVRTARVRGSQWQIDPNRIGVIGSSAGGHLAATLLTQFARCPKIAGDDIDQQAARPDLGVLCYSVVSIGEHTHEDSRRNLLGDQPAAALIEELSAEAKVSRHTPPCFSGILGRTAR